MNRYEKAAHLALAKRLRSMIPEREEFEFVSSEEQNIASNYFIGLTIKIADQLSRRAK